MPLATSKPLKTSSPQRSKSTNPALATVNRPDMLAVLSGSAGIEFGCPPCVALWKLRIAEGSADAVRLPRTVTGGAARAGADRRVVCSTARVFVPRSSWAEKETGRARSSPPVPPLGRSVLRTAPSLTGDRSTLLRSLRFAEIGLRARVIPPAAG